MNCQIPGCLDKHYGRGFCKKHHQWRWNHDLLPKLPKPSLMDRIEEAIERVPESGCWLWTRAINNKGYAHISINNKARYVHRAIYEMLHGPIPSDLEICHSCDVPCCCNPAHLFLGTHEDNMQDSARKGRAKQPKPRFGYAHHAAALTPEQVRYIRTSKDSGPKIAKHLGVSTPTVYRCRAGETYK